jgi:competence protein ComEA
MLLKSRPDHQIDDRTAFSVPSSDAIVIRITGDVPFPGIYSYARGTNLSGVINMTIHDSDRMHLSEQLARTVIKSGDKISINNNCRNHFEILISRMSAKEMMVLGIPLDPDALSRDEWESLPGIGKALAERIIDDRQKNGDFHSIGALCRVPGIGNSKINQIIQFF